MNLPIQRLSYYKIGQIANEFLKKYHPNFFLPIPIEEIVEQKLKIKITQEMSLKKDYDVEGFLISDFSTIFVDFNMYLKHENRTRFTIAHEVGHLILHRDIFKKLNINSVEKLNDFSIKLTDEQYGWLEYQAYSFASHVLVPKDLLIKELKKRIGKIPSMERPEVLAPIIQDLPDIFNVSDAVMLRRLQKEEIIQSNS